jgi:hypothetical protein
MLHENQEIRTQLPLGHQLTTSLLGEEATWVQPVHACTQVNQMPAWQVVHLPGQSAMATL